MSKLIVFATVSVGVFAFVVVYLASPIYATSSGTNTGSIQMTQDLSNKINSKVAAKSIQNNQKIVKMLQGHINSLSSQGKDVRKLNDDLFFFKNMAKSFAFEYSSFINVLKDTKKIGFEKTRMIETKLVLNQVKQKAQNIFEYLNTVIREDLEKAV